MKTASPTGEEQRCGQDREPTAIQPPGIRITIRGLKLIGSDLRVALGGGGS